MVSSFVVGFRETFEAALIIGIILVYLGKMDMQRYYRHVFAGALAGIIVSLGSGLIPNMVESIFSAVDENIFNAVILYTAVAVMTSMIFYMHQNARFFKSELEGKTRLAIEDGRLYGIVLLAFIGVFREGVETVLFMWGIATSAETGAAASQLVASCIGGAVMAVMFSWLFFGKLLGRFSLKQFFKVTSIMLLVITAGMFAKATGKLIKADLISPIIPQLWNSTWLLNEKGNISGKIISAMTGYKSKPSLMEVIAYSSYIVTMLAAVNSKLFAKCLPCPQSQAVDMVQTSAEDGLKG